MRPFRGLTELRAPADEPVSRKEFDDLVKQFAALQTHCLTMFEKQLVVNTEILKTFARR